MSTIRFAPSLVEELKQLAAHGEPRVETVHYTVLGPLKAKRKHLVLVLMKEACDPSTIVTGNWYPIPQEIGSGFLASSSEFIKS